MFLPVGKIAPPPEPLSFEIAEQVEIQTKYKGYIDRQLKSQEKFDKQKEYIRQWVPEFGTDAYPEPIVDHKMARQRCLDTYKAGLALADQKLNAVT